jgi:hypothetical protein
MAMQNSEYHHAVFPGETPATRQRMQDVCDAFEKLEKELRQHIEQLRGAQVKKAAAVELPLSHMTAD